MTSRTASFRTTLFRAATYALLGLCAAGAAPPDPQRDWEARYQAWQEEQARLDDNFLLSLGVGYSPTRVDANVDAEAGATPPYSELRLLGTGLMTDFRMGWMIANDIALGNGCCGRLPMHDQVFFTLDLLTRSTFLPSRRVIRADSAEGADVFRPAYMLDLIAGIGMTYLIYPSRTSLGFTLGVGTLGMQDADQSVRTQFGPAVNLRVAQEWKLRENWRTGISFGYGYAQSVNPPQSVNGTRSFRETYGSHLLSILWINSFTPPKYRRGLPPSRPPELP